MRRLVLGLRWKPATGPPGRIPERLEFSELVRALLAKLDAIGGRVVAFGDEYLAFDFVPEVLDQAIELVTGYEEQRVGLLACGIGVAQGDSACLLEAGARVALLIGSGPTRAAQLARLARPGQILLDPGLDAIKEGRLLTRGAVLGVCHGERIRGLRLDLRYPWRQPRPLARLLRPLPCGPHLARIDYLPGKLLLVLGARGLGGTRVLEEIQARHGRAVLRVGPGALGEPLGALRSALRRICSGSSPRLTAGAQASLESLLAGEGLDLESTSQLLAEWFGSSPGSAFLVDDASEADRDSLEAIARAAELSGIAVVARITDPALLPDPLAGLPLAGEVRLEPLLLPEAMKLVRSLVGVGMEESVAARWARRGGGIPLATVEALRLGLSRGELVWEGDRLLARDRVAGRGRPRSAEHWMGWRIRLLDADARRLLDAIGIHGGQATLNDLRAFFELVGEATDCDAASRRLVEECLVERTGEQQLELPSATLRALVVARLPQSRRVSWHRALFELWGEGERPLALVSAVVHALCSLEPELARRFARSAAAAATAAGLVATGTALESYASTGNPAWLETRGLVRRELLERSEPACPGPSIVPPQIQVRDFGSEPQRSRAMIDQSPAAGRGPGLEPGLRGGPGDSRGEGTERRAALDSLARGEVGEALRRMRCAKQRATELGPAEQSRAALGYAVALAAAGRTSEALLEALEALARARQLADIRGERACARFVAQLAEQAGKPAVARAWLALAERRPA